MTHRAAMLLCDLAIFVLPETRKLWGHAMIGEVAQIADTLIALRYASGCCLAALRSRMTDFESRFVSAIWALALMTCAFAAVHIRCAVRGVAVALGGPDSMLDAWVRNGLAKPETVGAYHAALPFVIGCFLALGLVHLVAAYCLVRLQLRRFFVAWCAAMAIAAIAVAIQLSVIWTLDGLPSEFFAAILQLLGMTGLLAWSNGRHRHLERMNG